MESLSEQNQIFLPQNIRCLRKRLNYSQEELGSQIGLNRGNIASYENGTAEPKICNLLKLANLFSVSILDLTKMDLRQETNFNTASHKYQKMSHGEMELLEQFLSKAEELKAVMDSLHHCHSFKKKSIAGDDKNMQTIVHYFDQLYELTMTLYSSHTDLLEFIKCRLK